MTRELAKVIAPRRSLTVVVAEDHGVVADGIATMLSFEDDMEVLRIVSTADALIEAVRELRPDIALVDVNLHESDGLTAVGEIVASDADTHCIALTMYTDLDTVSRAVSAGVAGYLPKNVRREELVQAVRAVAEGKGVLHPDVTRPFLDRVSPVASTADLDTLSTREMEVLEQLAAGKTTRLIAEALGLGEETVKSHLSRIYDKLGANDRVQAVVTAIRRGLVR